MSALADDVEAGYKQEGIDLAAYLELCSTDNGCRIAYTHINGDPDDVFTLTITVRKETQTEILLSSILPAQTINSSSMSENRCMIITSFMTGS